MSESLLVLNLVIDQFIILPQRTQGFGAKCARVLLFFANLAYFFANVAVKLF